VQESRKRCGSYSIKQTGREDIHIWGGVSTIAPVPYDDDETTVVGDSASWSRIELCGVAGVALRNAYRPHGGPDFALPHTRLGIHRRGRRPFSCWTVWPDIGWLVCWPSLAEQRTSGKDRQRALYPSRVLASLSRIHPEQLLLTQSEVAVFASTFLLQKKKKINWLRELKVAKTDCSFGRKRLYPGRAKNARSRASPPFSVFISRTYLQKT
jgi:hypothetical protein